MQFQSQNIFPKRFNILTVNKTLKRIKGTKKIPGMKRKMLKGKKRPRLCTNP
jgi:hypothetical protein